MPKPRLLDLFCGDGGCTKGYQRAGFYVVGIDKHRKRNYCGDDFVQADAMIFPLDGFDVIHASPPCQAYSVTRNAHHKQHPDLLAPTRERLLATGKPYVLENVIGAPVFTQASFDLPESASLLLCGTMFDLKADDPASLLYLQRHRWFESNVALFPPKTPCTCNGRDIGGVYGGGSRTVERAKKIRHGGYTPSASVAKVLMDIDWMSYSSLKQAIPPAYTEFIGAQLLERIKANA